MCALRNAAAVERARDRRENSVTDIGAGSELLRFEDPSN